MNYDTALNQHDYTQFTDTKLSNDTSVPEGYSNLKATIAPNFPRACEALSLLMERQGLEWSDWNEWGTKWAKNDIKKGGFYRKNTCGGMVGIMHRLHDGGYLVLALQAAGVWERHRGGVRIPDFDQNALIATYASAWFSEPILRLSR